MQCGQEVRDCYLASAEGPAEPVRARTRDWGRPRGSEEDKGNLTQGRQPSLEKHHFSCNY